MRRSALLRLAVGALLLAAAAEAAAEVKTTVDLRLREEVFSTPSPNAALDRDYSFTNARLRLGADASWRRLKLHGMVQAAGTFGLPRAGAFGTGPVYFGANRGDRDPSHLDVAEASVAWQGDEWRLTAGRQPYSDGFEAPTGVKPLDELKRARFAERLVGTLDFTNVSRRFDGLTFAGGAGSGHLAAFYLRPLTGAFAYRDAFEPLDDVEVWGATYTALYGTWLPRGELRFFGIRYRDERRAARAAGGEIEVDTLGASLVMGTEADALLAWTALQRGDFGVQTQDAWAVILGAQHRFVGALWQPALYVGTELASGDARGGDRGAFFNLVPTNHKFFGALDYSAFSNLRDHYVELRLQPAPAVKASAALHSFALANVEDAWYGGSGAFNEGGLGYQARRPAAGDFPGRDLGRALHLELLWSPRPDLDLRAGGARFWGAEAARAVLRAEKDGGWAYLELAWKR